MSNYWDRFTTRRTTRRTWLGGAAGAAAGVGGALLVGCGDSGSSSSATTAASSATSASGTGSATSAASPSQQPKTGGEVKISAGAPPSLDIQQTYNINTTKVMGMVYNRLVKWKAGPGVDSGDRTIVSDLAQSWEQPDDLTYNFKLRPGVKWQNVSPLNGRGFVAGDVKYSYERLLDPATKAAYASYYSVTDQINVVDDSTVQFKLKNIFTPMLDYIASYYSGWIFPREAVEKFGDLKNNAIGTGPFTLKSFDPSSSWSFAKNPNYFESGKPYVDSWQFFNIPDPSASFSRLLSGQFDWGSVSAANLSAFKSTNPDAKLIDYMLSIGYSLYISLPNQKFKDIRVRQAIRAAVDQQQLIDGPYQKDALPSGMIPPPISTFALSQADVKKLYWTYDPQKAKQLLSDAGYGPNNPLELTVSLPSVFATGSLGDVQTTIVDQLNRVGIKAKGLTPDFAISTQQLASKQYDLYVQGVASPEPDEYAFNLTAKGPRNFMGWDDAPVTDLVNKERSAKTQQERIDLVRQMEARIADQVPFVPIVCPKSRFGVHKRVQNFSFHIDYSDQYLNTNAWLNG